MNGCFDIMGKSGPGVQLTKCYGTPNDEFKFDHSGVWSGGTGAFPYPRRCMQGDHDTKTQKQIWAKPLPGGSMAVLVVNNLMSHASFLVDLENDLNMTTGVWQNYLVRDVWARKDIGYITQVLTVENVPRH